MMTVRAIGPDGLPMLLIGLTPEEVQRLARNPELICEGTLPEATSVQCVGVTTVLKAQSLAAILASKSGAA